MSYVENLSKFHKGKWAARAVKSEWNYPQSHYENKSSTSLACQLFESLIKPYEKCRRGLTWDQVSPFYTDQGFQRP